MSEKARRLKPLPSYAEKATEAIKAAEGEIDLLQRPCAEINIQFAIAYALVDIIDLLRDLRTTYRQELKDAQRRRTLRDRFKVPELVSDNSDAPCEETTK